MGSSEWESRLCSAVLAIVHAVEARPVAGAGIKGPIGAEPECPDRMARILLAPVLDEDRLWARDRASADAEPRQPGAHHAAVCRRTGRGRTAIVAAADWPAATEDVVVGVEDVNPRPRRKGGVRQARVQRESEQPAIPEVVDVRRQVREGRRRRIIDAVVNLQDAALLGHEDPAIGGELEIRRVHQTGAEDDRFSEAGRERIYRRLHGAGLELDAVGPRRDLLLEESFLALTVRRSPGVNDGRGTDREQRGQRRGYGEDSRPGMCSRLQESSPPTSIPARGACLSVPMTVKAPTTSPLGGVAIGTVVERAERHRHLGLHRCVKAPVRNSRRGSALSPRADLAEDPDHEHHGGGNDGQGGRIVSVEPERTLVASATPAPAFDMSPGPRPIPKESQDREHGDGKACDEQRHEHRGSVPSTKPTPRTVPPPETTRIKTAPITNQPTTAMIRIVRRPRAVSAKEGDHSICTRRRLFSFR